MKNNDARKKPSVATLIRDGYLMDHEVEDSKQVAKAQLEWMDDYSAHQLDNIDDLADDDWNIFNG